MLVRRDAFEAVGGFDEELFLYCEDTDLCRRLLDGGPQPCASSPRADGAPRRRRVLGRRRDAGDRRAQPRLLRPQALAAASAPASRRSASRSTRPPTPLAALMRPASRRGHLAGPRAAPRPAQRADARPLLVPDPPRHARASGRPRGTRSPALAEHGLDVTVVTASCERPLPDGRAPDRDAAAGRRQDPVPRARLRRAPCACTTAAPPRCSAASRPRRRPLAGRSAPSARSRRRARLGIPGLLERPNAHTALRVRGGRAGPRASSASRSTRRARTRDARSAWRARSASTPRADRLLCPSDFVAGTFRDAGRARGAAPAPPLRLRPRALRRRRPRRRRLAPVHRRLRRSRRAAQGPAHGAAGVAGLRRRRARPLRDRGRDRPPTTARCSSRCSRTRASPSTASSTIPAALMRCVRRPRPAVGRGGQRARDLRGARLRLRARRLRPHRRRLRRRRRRARAPRRATQEALTEHLRALAGDRELLARPARGEPRPAPASSPGRPPERVLADAYARRARRLMSRRRGRVTTRRSRASRRRRTSPG